MSTLATMSVPRPPRANYYLVIGATLDGDSALRTGMGASAESYFRSNVVDRAIIDTAEHDLMKLLNANNYQKGSWVLHMLRGLVGDSAFFRGIRDYYGSRRDSTALSGDFERVMEKASKQDLDWFFGNGSPSPATLSSNAPGATIPERSASPSSSRRRSRRPGACSGCRASRSISRASTAP